MAIVDWESIDDITPSHAVTDNAIQIADLMRVPCPEIRRLRGCSIDARAATLSTLLAAAEKRLRRGHNDNCGARGNRSCCCGHDELAVAYERAKGA